MLLILLITFSAVNDSVVIIFQLDNQRYCGFEFFSSLLLSQKRMAMIAEMIHTSSLLHDDVIDDAITRRNKASVNQCFTQKEAILAGDFILSKAAILLAQLKSTQAVANFSQIINDLVKGSEVFLKRLMKISVTFSTRRGFV